MKEKLMEAGKMVIIMVVLFGMAWANVFPIYWRIASGIWFLVFAVSLLDELHRYLIKN